MEPHNIDSIIKKSINESEDYYDVEANNAKERVWNQVQHKKKKNAMSLFYHLLVAACILLFISTSIVTILNLKARKQINALVELNTDLENRAAINMQNVSIINEPQIAVTVNSPDTVYIEKVVNLTKTIIQKEQITDTVYINQIEYIERELPKEPMIAIENSIPVDSTFQIITDRYETEILISNTDALSKGKRKKFKLKFGGNQNPSSNGTIALSSKL